MYKTREYSQLLARSTNDEKTKTAKLIVDFFNDGGEHAGQCLHKTQALTLLLYFVPRESSLIS
jgi:hypothetical protein